MRGAKNKGGAKRCPGAPNPGELERSFFEEAPDSMLGTDPHGRFIVVNRQAAALTGYTRKELLSMAIKDLINPEDHAGNPINLKDRRTGGIAAREYRILRKDGRLLPVEGSIRRQPEGNILVVIRAITKRAQAEWADRTAQQQLFNIIEFLPDATFVIDRNKRVIAWNRACETMTGVKKKAMLGKDKYAYSEPFYGKRHPILIDLLDLPSHEVEANYKYVKRIGTAITAESFIPRLRGGQGAHLWGIAAPLFDQKGRRCGSIEAIRDMTEQKRIEQALRESELKHRTLFETAGDAIMLMRDNRFIDCNDKTLAMFGCTREQIIGAPPYEFSPPTQPDGRSSREKALEKINLAATEGLQFFEWEHCRRDRTPFHAEVSLTRVKLDGEILLQAIVRDITKRKAAEETLRQSESTLRSVFRAAPIGICIMKDRVYQSANKYWCEQFGYPEETIIGKSTRMLYDNDGEYNRVGRELYADLHTKGLASVETKLRCRDGAIRQVIVTAAPIRQDDLSSGTVVIIHDITEQRQADEQIHRLHEDLQRHAAELERRVEERTSELAVARDHAEQADRIKSAFLATMSHELRTPLNSIIGFTGLLLKGLAGELNNEQTKQLRMVKESGQHLLDLINDVLDISKIEAGQIEIANAPFDLPESIQKVIHTVTPLADKKQLPLITHIAQDVGRISSDRRRIEQILLNLLSNAIKFTEQGEVTLTAKMASGTPNEPHSALRISVADTGIGIKRTDMDKLFQPFRQLDTGLTRQHEGTGLGLAICKRLIERLGGTITVESELGKGSTFQLTLPIQRGEKS